MSYDIELRDSVSDEVLKLDSKHHMYGGTYTVGGTHDCSLNVTWNYAKHYYNVFPGADGIRTIYGMTGLESIPVLESAIGQLGDDASDNYWDGTEGNAKRALVQLLTLAKARPDGVWYGD